MASNPDPVEQLRVTVERLRGNGRPFLQDATVMNLSALLAELDRLRKIEAAAKAWSIASRKNMGIPTVGSYVDFCAASNALDRLVTL